MDANKGGGGNCKCGYHINLECTLLVLLLVIPIPLVVLWVVANIYNSSVDDTHCGQGLSMVPTYWILEGPRIFVIVVSLGHLFF